MQFKAFDSLSEISAEPWNTLTCPDFPFADHAYLSALETSLSVGGDSGWKPIYLTLWDGSALRGALFVYLKDNSYGEYIFDWAWLRAFHDNGIPYFPKVVAAVPFTPATGPKLLVHPEADAPTVRRRLIEEALRLTEASRSSSLHFLFASAEELPEFSRAGLLLRHSYQFHWTNRGYARFEDFLGALKSRKRKQILVEREQVAESGVSVEVIEGDALKVEHARLMYRFYLTTIEKMGAIAYLTPLFFETVFAEMRGAIVLMLAKRDGEWIAGALNYRKGGALFGRYWGCSQEVRGLHFELCYYQGIEYAIARGLRLFEAGAQGEHKLARGFLPQLTYSAHWIEQPAFRSAIANFVEQEKAGIAELFQEYGPHAPYRDGVS
jgi:predicted N-acyltransferase